MSCVEDSKNSVEIGKEEKNQKGQDEATERLPASLPPLWLIPFVPCDLPRRALFPGLI